MGARVTTGYDPDDLQVDSNGVTWDPVQGSGSEAIPGPSGWLARMVAEIRGRRGWSQAQLSAEVRALGLNLDRPAISKIESGLRNVTLDEAFTLAVALDVAPVHLFLPRDNGDRVTLTPVVIYSPEDARKWFRGTGVPPRGEESVYRSEVPEGDTASLADAASTVTRLLTIATENADQLMAETRDRADQIISEAHKEARKIRTDALQVKEESYAEALAAMEKAGVEIEAIKRSDEIALSRVDTKTILTELARRTGSGPLFVDEEGNAFSLTRRTSIADSDEESNDGVD